MPLDQLAKRALRARLHKLIQQFPVIHTILHRGLYLTVPAGCQNRTTLAMRRWSYDEWPVGRLPWPVAVH
jgi:hypothetical protein